MTEIANHGTHHSPVSHCYKDQAQGKCCSASSGAIKAPWKHFRASWQNITEGFQRWGGGPQEDPNIPPNPRLSDADNKKSTARNVLTRQDAHLRVLRHRQKLAANGGAF